MRVAIPVQSAASDSELVASFGKAKQFALVTEKGEVSFVSVAEVEGGRDAARTLIANDVDTVIVSHLGLNPYVLLKSYGIRVYCEEEANVKIDEALKSLRQEQLMEVTPSNYQHVFGSADRAGQTG